MASYSLESDFEIISRTSSSPDYVMVEMDGFKQPKPDAEVTDEQAASVTDKQAASVTDEQAASVADEQAASVADEQAASVADELAALVADEQAALVADEQAAFVADEQAAFVADEQAAFVADEQAHQINSEETDVKNQSIIRISNYVESSFVIECSYIPENSYVSQSNNEMENDDCEKGSACDDTLPNTSFSQSVRRKILLKKRSHYVPFMRKKTLTCDNCQLAICNDITHVDKNVSFWDADSDEDENGPAVQRRRRIFKRVATCDNCSEKYLSYRTFCYQHRDEEEVCSDSNKPIHSYASLELYKMYTEDKQKEKMRKKYPVGPVYFAPTRYVDHHLERSN